MSWYYSDSGSASVVKTRSIERLKQAAESCNRISSEVKAINSFAETVIAVCDQADGQCVRIEGAGSAVLMDGKLKSYQLDAKIEVFDMLA
jgi:hypothetical protein